MYDDDDAISAAMSSRRIPHGRSRQNGKGGKGSNHSVFDPLKTIGVYEIISATKGLSKAPDLRITIHGFSEGEEGLLATLRMGNVLDGMAVLAGSRNGLRAIVEDLEEEEEEDEEEEDEEDREEADEARSNDGESSNVESDETSDDEYDKTSAEVEDDRINRRAKAFEKNSFRNPKFWMCWKAKVKDSEGAEVCEKSMVNYIIFTGNDCSAFDGTLSSDVLGWDNIKIKGRKMKSGAAECSWRWMAYE